MKILCIVCVALSPVFITGCSWNPHPLVGKSHVAFRGDGPPSGTDTGSVICVFGTYAHPDTKWTVDPRKGEPPQVHSVTQSLDDVVTGIPSGQRVIRFSASAPTKAPPPICVDVEQSRTVILSVDYREQERLRRSH